MKFLAFTLLLLCSQSLQAQVAWLGEKTALRENTFFYTSYEVKFCHSFSRTECFDEVVATSLDETEKRDLVAAALERNFNDRYAIWFSMQLEEGEMLDILLDLYSESLRSHFRRENLVDFLTRVSPGAYVFTLHYAWNRQGYQEASGQPMLYDPATNKIFVGQSHYVGIQD